MGAPLGAPTWVPVHACPRSPKQGEISGNKGSKGGDPRTGRSAKGQVRACLHTGSLARVPPGAGERTLTWLGLQESTDVHFVEPAQAAYAPMQTDCMLANLLPGFREIRAPLAAGYIWLLTLWVGFSECIPEKESAQGVWGSLYHLSSIVGTAATLAGVSFVAYLVGCLLEVRARAIVHWFRFPEWWWGVHQRILGNPLSGQLDNPRMLQWTETSETSRGAAEPHSLIQPNESFTSLLSPEWGSRASRSALIDLAIHIHQVGGRSVNLSSVMGRFGDELDQLAIRLQARNIDLYGTYDRAVAEADLRVNVGFSASILVSAVAAKSNLEILSCIPFAWFLIARGQQKAREANDVLIQAVVSGELESKVLSSALPQLSTSSASSMGRDADEPPRGSLGPAVDGDSHHAEEGRP
jgi:hypothetical protein